MNLICWCILLLLNKEKILISQHYTVIKARLNFYIHIFPQPYLKKRKNGKKMRI